MTFVDDYICRSLILLKDDQEFYKNFCCFVKEMPNKLKQAFHMIILEEFEEALKNSELTSRWYS